jgi:hypothetical protein
MAFIEETTQGEIVDPTAASFNAIREGSGLVDAVESTESDELRNSIGSSKGFVTSEAPTGTVNRYVKTSGTEGVAPEDAILYASALGDVETHATEISTVAGSTAGDSTTRAQLKVADGDIATGELKVGQCVLIKDGTNGYAVRPIYSLDDSASPDEVNLGFNLGIAPASGVALGKATFWDTKNENQKFFSAHEYQSATTSSAYHIAHGGCRTQSITLDYPANDLATAVFEIAGINFGENPIRIGASNKYIDFTDGTGTVAAILDEDVYQTPYHLADAIAAKMTAASAPSDADIITCTFDKSTGKYTIASDGTVLSLLWNTGTNNANSIATTIGFDNVADDTGVLTYTADNELQYGPGVTPSYDDSDPGVVKENMLLLGDFDDYICFGGQAFNITINTPSTNIPNWCEESGIDESVVLERTVPVTGTLKFAKHDAERTYKMLKNETISAMFVTGQKSAGNWVAGTVQAVYLPEVSIQTNNPIDNDGYIVQDFAGNAIVGTDGLEDVYITQL